MATRDSQDKVISEEMVKLIFLPIKETLATTTEAINKASEQVKDLARLYTAPPGRVDIIKQITDALDTHVTGIKGEIDKHDMRSSVRGKENIEVLNKTIQEHQEDMERSLGDFNPSFNKLAEAIRENSVTMTQFATNVGEFRTSVENNNRILETGLTKIETQLSNMMWVVGIAFTLCMVVAAIIMYFLDKSSDKEKDEKPKKSSELFLPNYSLYSSLSPELQRILSFDEKTKIMS